MAAPCFPAQLKKFEFTRDEIADLWAHAKTAYIDKGASLSDTIHGVGTDLGLKPEWVADALTKPKAIRRVSDDLYRKMSVRRRVVQEAKSLVRSIDTPGYKRAIQGVLKTPFAVAVYGHGTVGMETHVGAALFRPSSWNTYFSNFGRQFKYWTNTAAHEAAMQHLVRDPDFVRFNRAGLAIDPDRTYTDYGTYAKFLGKLGEPGKRGFDVLKIYRLEEAKAQWAKTSASIKNDPEMASEMAKLIAENVNHGSGVADIGHGTPQTIASNVLFAAKLEASRWARIIGDPIKTTETFLNWKNASAPERQIALTRLKHAVEFTAFYYSTLLANNAMLAAFGSKNRVNMTDPTKSDFLKHKIGDHSVALEGSLLAPVRFLAKVGYDLWGPQSKFQKSTHETRFDAVGGAAADYLRGKLAPFPSIATDLATGSDFSGRPLPLSNAPKPRKGDKPYSWPEYALQHGPIPLSGASREVFESMKEQGMSLPQITMLMKALPVLGAEMTGVKIGKASESYQHQSKSGSLIPNLQREMFKQDLTPKLF